MNNIVEITNSSFEYLENKNNSCILWVREPSLKKL